MCVCVRLCVSVWRPCLLRRAVGDRDRECGQQELSDWVMNLLLRHSLKHNYTHQSQEGFSRPLTLS